MKGFRSRLAVLAAWILAAAPLQAAPWLMWGKANNIPGNGTPAGDQVNPYGTPPLDGQGVLPVNTNVVVLGSTNWFYNNANDWTFDTSSTVPEIPGSPDANSAQVWVAAYIQAPTGGSVRINAGADDWTTLFLNFTEIWRYQNTERTLSLRTGLNVVMACLGENGGGYNGHVYLLDLPGNATVSTNYDPADLVPFVLIARDGKNIMDNEIYQVGSNLTINFSASHPVSTVTAVLTSVQLDGMEQLSGTPTNFTLITNLTWGLHTLYTMARDSTVASNIASRTRSAYAMSPPATNLLADITSPPDGSKAYGSATLQGKAYGATGAVLVVSNALVSEFFPNTGFSGTPTRRFLQFSPMNVSYGTVSAAEGETPDSFTVRTSGILTLSANGYYWFSGGADDHVWVTVDGRGVLWKTNYYLTAGDHVVQVGFGEDGGGANWSWSCTGPAGSTLLLKAVIPGDSPHFANYVLDYDLLQSSNEVGKLIGRDWVIDGGWHYPRNGNEPIRNRWLWPCGPQQPVAGQGSFGRGMAPVFEPRIQSTSIGLELAGRFHAEANDTYYVTNTDWDDGGAVILDNKLLYQSTAFVDTNIYPFQSTIALTSGWYDLKIILWNNSDAMRWRAEWARLGDTNYHVFGYSNVQSATDSVMVVRPVIAAATTVVGNPGSAGLLGQWDLPKSLPDGAYPVHLFVNDVLGTMQSETITLYKRTAHGSTLVVR